MDSAILMKRKSDAVLKKKCMNCGKTLLDNGQKDLYARRFCSAKCKSQYFGEEIDLKDA